MSAEFLANKTSHLPFLLLFKLTKTNCFWLWRNAFVTNYDVSSYIFGRQGTPEAISKPMAVKNGKKPIVGVFETRLLILMDMQYTHLNISFTLYAPKYIFWGIAS